MMYLFWYFLCVCVFLGVLLLAAIMVCDTSVSVTVLHACRGQSFTHSPSHRCLKNINIMCVFD